MGATPGRIWDLPLYRSIQNNFFYNFRNTLKKLTRLACFAPITSAIENGWIRTVPHLRPCFENSLHEWMWTCVGHYIVRRRTASCSIYWMVIWFNRNPVYKCGSIRKSSEQENFHSFIVKISIKPLEPHNLVPSS